MSKRCVGCMKLKEKSPVCEHCGYNEHVPNEPHQLPIGTVLQGRYQVGKVLGQGGFGITYIGWDLSLETVVAIKEFYPGSIVNRDCSVTQNVTCNGSHVDELFTLNRERFLREARILAKLSHVPGIVRVQNLFGENNTAYIVMEYVEGIDLKHYIRMQGRTLTVEETFAVMRPVMYALSKVHEAELVHRDISPDNIMIQKDGSIVLLDFGAAREVANADVRKDLTRSTQAILKHGFAPIEQYRSRGNLGPWTDIYALCATMYYCLTGKVPSEAPERVIGEDNVNWRLIPGLTETQIAALEQGLAMIPEKRIQTTKELWERLSDQNRSSFTQQAAPKPDPVKEQRRQKQEEVQRRRQEQEQLKQQRREQQRHEQEQKAQKKLEKQRLEQEKQKLRQQQFQEEKRQKKLPEEQEKRQQQELQQQKKLEEKQQHKQKKERNPLHVIVITALAVVTIILTVLPTFLTYMLATSRKNNRDGQLSVPEITIPIIETQEVPIPTYAEDAWKNNVLMNSPHKKYEGINRSEITSVTFLDTTIHAPSSTWDVSKNQDRSVLAWAVENEKFYDIYIAANGGINAAYACSSLFSAYTNLAKVEFNNCFHTEDVADMSFMFSGCGRLREIDVSSINTSNVITMSNMFASSGFESLDLSSFDTKNVNNMKLMFHQCSSLISLNLNSFNTENVTDMGSLFGWCSSLVSVDLSSFDTQNVSNMTNMFACCSSLTTLDLSSFKTENVTNMYWLFRSCISLVSLDLSNFDTRNVANMDSMFYSCTNLNNPILNNCDESTTNDILSEYHRR